ncbi:unnamed protein product [Rotaria sordida]|uniref:Uncharacterized protein n=1 Tax=Rotaria sordida TaxID=392033 RepID=A0A815I309_9BILA|nr:unnamed protein product [Rotaria sordida]CAF1360071.1 unnamed protein product [Rotaria sordida]
MDDLLPIFHDELNQYQQELEKRRVFNIYKSEGNIGVINALESNDRFIWMYNFAITFFRMHKIFSDLTAQQEKEDLTTELRMLYKSNIKALKEIDYFNYAYKPETSIKSYEEMESIRETLNKALCRKNFELISRFRFFIFDLFQQIKSNYITTHTNERTDHSYQTFYDNQWIPFNQIEGIINSKTQLISINLFWSMNLNENDATSDSTKHDTNTIPRDFKIVRFQIKVLQSYCIKDVCPQGIENLYYYQSGNRILFPPGTIFKVTHCSKSNENEKLYSIKLELASLDFIKIELGEIINFWLNNEILKTNQTSLARLIMHSGQLDETKKYYELLNKYFTRYERLKKYFYYGLGVLAQKNKDDDLLRARVKCALADMYFSKHSKVTALKNYEEALSIFDKHRNKTSLDIVECYISIGKIYKTFHTNNDYESALKSFKNAIVELDYWVSTNIRIQWKYLPFKIVSLLKNIGELFRFKHEFNKAYTCQYKVLLIYQQFSIWNDFQVGSLYEEIGRIYQDDKKLQLALLFYHKAADIYYWFDFQTNNVKNTIQQLIEDNITEMNYSQVTEQIFYAIFVFVLLIFLYYCKRNVKFLKQRKDNNCRQILVTIQEHLKKNSSTLSNYDICKSSSLSKYNRINNSFEQMSNKRLDGTITILNKYDPNKVEIIDQSIDSSSMLNISYEKKNKYINQILSNISYITTDKSKQIDDSIESQQSTNINLTNNKDILFSKNHLSNSNLKTNKQIIINLEQIIHTVPSCIWSIDENSNLSKNDLSEFNKT